MAELFDIRRCGGRDLVRFEESSIVNVEIELGHVVVVISDNKAHMRCPQGISDAQKCSLGGVQVVDVLFQVKDSGRKGRSG